MATKKMRLTFLWADEAVAVKDYQAKFSQQLVDWATAFYRQYEFEFDILPKPGGKIQEAYKHCLTKSGGYEPDYVSWEEAVDRRNAVSKKLQAEIDELKEMHDVVLAPQEVEKRREVDAILGLPIGTLPPAEVPAAMARAQQVFAEHQEVVAQIAANRKRLAEAEQELKDRRDKLLDEIISRNFDIPVRALLGRKILASASLRPLVPITTGNENAAIVDPYRLKVLFCRFALKEEALRMRPPSAPFGVTPQAIGMNMFGEHFVFSGTYILINVARFEQITLAHEMVHAAGRLHIDGEREKMKKISEWIRTIRQDPFGGKPVIPPIMHTVDPGYVDGPDDDIVNYEAKGKKPEEVKLYDEALMSNAYFVAAPGTVPVPGS